MKEFDWAQQFADILDRNIAYLPIQEFQKANDLLRLYRSDITPLQGEIPLRDLIEATFSAAAAEGEDPYAAILRTIAQRAHGWEAHSSDDASTTEDIRHWLECEASAGEEAK